MTPAPPIESFERLGAAFPLTADTERKRMLVIVNPYATTVSDRLKNLVVYALQGRYEVEAVDTTGKDHATDLTRQAALEGYDVVVACGGADLLALLRPQPAADGGGAARRRDVPGRHGDRPEWRPVHVLPEPPAARRRGRGPDQRRPCGRRPAPLDADRDADRDLADLLA